MTKEEPKGGADVKRLRREIQVLRRDIDKLQFQRDKAHAENERLRAELKPFAEMAENLADHEDDERLVLGGAVGKGDCCVKDIRKAARAVTG